MAELDLSLAPELCPSTPAWIQCVLADFDTFLADHASAEKKASGMALSVAAHYPDQPELVSAMADLAVEELSHYREVIRIMLTRKVTPAPDVKDPYVNTLNKMVRRGPENFLLDRLLVGAVVERRGAERFALVADHVDDLALQKFYASIAASEARHWTLFVELALAHCNAEEVWPRLHELAEAEGSLIAELPIRAALH